MLHRKAAARALVGIGSLTLVVGWACGRDDCARIKVGDRADLLADAASVVGPEQWGEHLAYVRSPFRSIGPYDDLLCCSAADCWQGNAVCPCDGCTGLSGAQLWQLKRDHWGKDCPVRREADTMCVVWIQAVVGLDGHSEERVIARGEFCREPE